MLGKEIFNALDEKNFTVFGVDLVKNDLLPYESQIIGDITNVEFITSLLKKTAPDIIIHCAAIVNLSICEQNKKLAYSLHVEATKNLASYKSGKTKLIYISTDSVFDGKKGNYLESDTPNPLNFYAESKLEGEEATRLNPNHIIARTNIFGFNNPLRNSLAEWAIKNFISNKPINGFTDVIFNAIYTKQLAQIIADLIIMNYMGVINVTSQNAVSKYDFLVKLASALGVSENIVNKSNSEDIRFEIERPKLTNLNTTKLQQMINVPTIDSGILEMVKDYKKTKEYLL